MDEFLKSTLKSLNEVSMTSYRNGYKEGYREGVKWGLDLAQKILAGEVDAKDVKLPEGAL